MKQTFTKLFAAIALLVSLAIPMGMWGQTKATVTDNMTAADLAATGTSYTAFSNVSLTSDAVYAGKSALNNNANIQLRSSGSDCGIVSTVSGGKIKSITINVASGSNTIDVYGKNTAYTGAAQLYNATNQGTKLGSVSSTGTITVSGDYEYVGIRSYNGAVYISSIAFVWETTGSSVTATTVTIDDSGISNTDVYTSTTAGSLSATVKENTNNTIISGAAVTWSSSNTNIATIDNSGAVTLVAAGTTTITASYAGESGIYGSSSATYVLTVTSSEPYVQPTTIEIIPNYEFWGKTGQFSGDAYSELEGSKDNVTLNWTKGSGSTYANSTAMRFYKDNELIFTAPEGYEITSIVITFSSTQYAPSDLSFTPGNYSLSETTGTWTGSSSTVTMSRPSNASSYAQISKFTITLGLPSAAVATTTTINVPQNFNTDIYQGITAGTLTATVKDNENNVISGATVTWSSSNNDVATIDANGAVTLVAVGTTTITASYAGVEDEYLASSASRELTVTSSAPYVQPNPVEINMNYVWLGSNNGSNLNENQLPVVKVDDNVTTTIAKGTSSTNPRGDADYIRIYSGSTLTFDAPDGYVITGIEFTTGGNNTWNAPTTSTGTLSNKTWTGNATSVVFTMTGSCFISKATITLGVPSADPYITVESDSFELTANEEEGYLEITCGNFTPTSLDVMFCDANGDALSEDPEWITLAIEPPVGETGDFVYYYAEPNSGAARTAYFMVFDDDVYSNIVTVTQNAPVVDYAFLPFEWDTFGTTPTGITNSGVSTGSSNAYLKFDSSGDYIVLQINEAPGALSFDVKGNPGNNNVWAGTFKVQTSVDGTTYSDLATYDNLPTNDYQSESFTTLNAAVRYIKWVYTEKEQGNVALDNIKLDKVYTKDIVGNTWYFIASPTGEAPINVDALGDLYYYDEPTHYWRNKKVADNADGFDFGYGKGYLCANENADVTLSFTGNIFAGNTLDVPVTYTAANGGLAGCNLVGNPFNCNAYIGQSYFVVGQENNEWKVLARSGAIAPFEGVMVKTAENVSSITFSKNQGKSEGNVTLALSRKEMTRGAASSSLVDNVIVSFDEGSQLEKLVFNNELSKLYIPQNGKDYAVVSAEAQGEMPVNFKASRDGEYTITVNPEGVELNYLHLIDNMTGMDVDLLQTPNYTFDATTSDYESRFRLVFAGASTSSATDETFAYYDGSEWQVSNEGEATLQVVDVMGRIVSTETVNGNFNLNLNQTAGVYMLRLINSNGVKTQKIVVR